MHAPISRMVILSNIRIAYGEDAIKNTLDEPPTHLDTATRRSLLEALRVFKGGFGEYHSRTT